MKSCSARGRSLFAGLALLAILHPALYADGPVSTGSNIYDPTGQTEVGAFGDGSLDFSAGATADSSGVVLVGVGGTGTVTIDGTNSAWTIGGGTFLGDGAAGSITVSNGGTLDTFYGPGASAITLGYSNSGTITVTGTGSTWNMTSDVLAEGLSLGRSGQGFLNVLDGGVVTTSLTKALSQVDLGELAGSSSTVVVDGAGSQWNVSGIGANIVTESGTGTITVSNGGAITANSINLSQRSILTVTGSSPDGTASTVTIGGLAVSSEDALGAGAAPIVMITHGGILNSGASIIGNGPSVTDTGAVTIDGAGSQWNEVGQLTVGASSGGGTITLTDGGVLNVSQTTSGTGDGTILLGGEASSTNVGTPASVGILYIGTGGAAGILNAAMVMGYGLPGTTPADSTIIFNHNSTGYYFTTTGTSSGTGVIISGNTQIETEAGTTILTALSNTTGATTLNGGVLSVSTLANGGTASGLGSSSNAAANLVLNGGTLRYTGASTSTNRLFTLGANGGTLDASGTGAVSFTNTGAMAFSTPDTAETLTLTGSSAAPNVLTVTLRDNGTQATSLVKSGAGTWQLNGANTYTGGTHITGGRLILNNNGATGTGSVLVDAAGTLGGIGKITPTGAHALDISGTLSPGGIAIGTGASKIGTLTIDSGSTTAAHVLTLESGALLQFDLGASLTSDSVSLLNGSAADILFNNTTINFTSLATGTLADGNYILFTAGSSLDYSGLTIGPDGVIIGGLNIGTGLDSYNADLALSGNNIVLQITGAAPEPSTWLLLSAGFTLLLFRLSRKPRQN